MPRRPDVPDPNAAEAAPLIEPTETWAGSEPSLAAASPQPIPERIGRYVLLDEVGRGGMGVVYRATDPELGREVALKVMLTGELSSPEQRGRFAREARAVAQLRHPGIVEIFDVGEDCGRPFFAMPFVPGGSLAERLGGGQRLPAREAARIGAALARSLHHAHTHRLVHRDVKPQNVLLDASDQPILTDFGLVKNVDGASVELTHGGQLLGTPAYMAPEQARGDLDAVGPRTDIYALGALLYRALTGHAVVDGPTTMAQLSQILTQAPAPVRRLAPEVHPDLALICHTALAKAPGDRFPTAQAMAEELDRFLDGVPVQITAPPLGRRLRAWCARHQRELLAVAAGLGGIAVLVGGVALVRWGLEVRAEVLRQAAAETHAAVMWADVERLDAAGRAEEADARVLAFVSAAANQGTQAVSRAWLQESTRQTARGDDDAALDAVAAAYASAAGRDEQVAALTMLAEMLYARGDWPQMTVALRTLDALGLHAEEAARVAPMRLQAALVRRDMVSAAALAPEDGTRRVLAALGQATPLDLTVDPEQADAQPLSEDGQPRLLLRPAAEGRLLVLDASQPSLPVLRTLDHPGASDSIFRFSTVDGAQRLLAVGHRDPMIAQVGDDALASLASLASLQSLGTLAPPLAALADLDRDGTKEMYVGYDRKMGRLDAQPDGRWQLDPDPVLRSAAGDSDIYALLAADLDHDGQEELVVGVGLWDACDLRVFSGDAGGLALQARARLGGVGAVTPLRLGGRTLLAALQTWEEETLLGLDAFSAAHPPAAQGIHLLALEGGQLRSLGFAPTSGIFEQERSQMFAADLDGDGEQELLFDGEDGWSGVYRVAADDSIHPLFLPGLGVLAVGDLDADGDDEIVAVELDSGAVWVLGTGDGALPVQAERPPAARRALPGALQGAQRAAWSRGQVLVEMGLFGRAADSLEALARPIRRSAAGIAILERTAEIAALGGEHARAGRLMEEAAASHRALDAPEAASAALASASRYFQAGDLIREEHSVLSAMGAREPALEARHAELTAFLEPPGHTIDLSGGLGEEWHVREPLGLRWTPARGGVTVQTFDQRLLAEVPLTWDGGPVGLAVTLSPGRTDWGCELRAELVERTRDGAPQTVSSIFVAQHGGGGQFTRLIGCEGTDLRLANSPPGAPVQIRDIFDAQRGERICSAVLAGEPPAEQVAPPVMFRPVLAAGHRPEDLALRITSSLRTAAHARCEVTLHELTLLGARPRTLPATPEEVAYRALAMGQPAHALAALQAPGLREAPSRAGLAAALAEQMQGQRAASRRTLARALRDDPLLGGLTPWMIFSADHTFADVFREALGPVYFQRLWEASADLLEEHPEAAPSRQILLQAAEGAEEIEPTSVSREVSVALTALLVYRAQSHRRDGALVRAAASLERAAEHASHSDDQAGLAAIHLEQARMLLDRHQPDDAIRLLRAALSASPNPEILADRVVLDPYFEPLSTHPAWEEIRAARRLGP